MTFTINAGLFSLLAIFYAYLYFKFRRETREYRVQSRRYKMFELRDNLALMRIDNEISDELFQAMYEFCNNALCVSDALEITQLAEAMHNAARTTTKSKLGRLAPAKAKESKRFAKIYYGAISHVVMWGLINSFARHPLGMISMLIQGALSEAKRDFSKLVAAKRQAHDYVMRAA